MGAEGLYGSNHGETTVQAWDVHGQANYNITDRVFWFGAARVTTMTASAALHTRRR